jgi:hypothetical protein
MRLIGTTASGPNALQDGWVKVKNRNYLRVRPIASLARVIRKNMLTRSGIPGLERKSSYLMTRVGVRRPKIGVIPFIIEVHHASLLSRMAAHFDGAI